MFKYVHHVHYVVRDLDSMVEYFEKNFGLKPEQRLEHKEKKIKEALYDIDGTTIQMSQPLDPNSNQGKFLAKNGPGVLHVAWGVDDINKAAADLKGKGNKLTGEGGGLTNSPLGYHTINIARDQTQDLWLQLAQGERKIKQ